MQKQNDKINFKLDMKRWLILGGFLLIIWFSLLTFWWLKADEITKDPCSVCAERLGEKVICTTGDINPITRIYYANWTIEDKIPVTSQNLK